MAARGNAADAKLTPFWHAIVKRMPWWAPRAALALVFGSMLIMLSLSPQPTKVRIARINRLVAEGRLGLRDAALSPRIAQQFTWLARHAGVRTRVVVDGPIEANQLTFLVSRPAYQDLTRCGTGNAVYDPSLNTIFVDELLIRPTEMNAIGTNSVNSMFSMRELPFVTSYLSFIVAHELGHWQKHDRSAAFFYYGWNEGAASLADEKAADASAVRTLLRAQVAGDMPAAVANSNAILAAAVDDQRVSGHQRAIADVIGGILMLVETSLFSSSPFSPYYADAAHPALIARVQSAVATIQRTQRAPLLPVQARLVVAEVRRFRALSDWRHRELMLPGPLQRADVRAGALWLGRTDIPELHGGELQEQIYRIPLADLRIDADEKPFLAPPPTAVGHSRVGKEYDYAEDLGGWINAKFQDGDPRIGLPGRSEPLGIRQYPVWGTDAHGASIQLGSSWSVPAVGALAGGEITSAELEVAVGRKLRSSAIRTGPPIIRGDRLLVPARARDDASHERFRIFAILALEPLTLELLPGFRFDTNVSIDVANAVQSGADWWVPARTNPGRGGDAFSLRRVSESFSRPFGSVPLLVGEIRSIDPAAPLWHWEPGTFRVHLLDGGTVLFGYDRDTLYAVQPRRTIPAVIFHPAAKGLRVLDLGRGAVAFWTLHARKVYLVETDEIGGNR